MMLRSKLTSWLGIAVAVFGALSAPDIIGILPPKWAHVIAIGGVILAALGRSLTAPTNTPRFSADAVPASNQVPGQEGQKVGV